MLSNCAVGWFRRTSFVACWRMELCLVASGVSSMFLEDSRDVKIEIFLVILIVLYRAIRSLSILVDRSIPNYSNSLVSRNAFTKYT